MKYLWRLILIIPAILFFSFYNIVVIFSGKEDAMGDALEVFTSFVCDKAGIE